MGGHHQILLLDLEVGHLGQGKVLLEGLPVFPVVEGDEEPIVGTGVEKAPPIRILPDHSHGMVVRDSIGPVGEEIPGLSVVVGPEDHGPVVVHPVPVHGNEHPARLMG